MAIHDVEEPERSWVQNASVAVPGSPPFLVNYHDIEVRLGQQQCSQHSDRTRAHHQNFRVFFASHKNLLWQASHSFSPAQMKRLCLANC